MTMHLPQPYQHMPPPSPADWRPDTIDPQQALAQAVGWSTAHGWRVETWIPGHATLVSGSQPNHILHLLLSVFTGGLWLPFWLLFGLTQKESRLVLSVDQWGRVSNSAAQPARPAVPKSWWARYNGWLIAACTAGAFLLLMVAAAG